MVRVVTALCLLLALCFPDLAAGARPHVAARNVFDLTADSWRYVAWQVPVAKREPPSVEVLDDRTGGRRTVELPGRCDLGGGSRGFFAVTCEAVQPRVYVLDAAAVRLIPVNVFGGECDKAGRYWIHCFDGLHTEAGWGNWRTGAAGDSERVGADVGHNADLDQPELHVFPDFVLAREGRVSLVSRHAMNARRCRLVLTGLRPHAVILGKCADAQPIRFGSGLVTWNGGDGRHDAYDWHRRRRVQVPVARAPQPWSSTPHTGCSTSAVRSTRTSTRCP